MVSDIFKGYYCFTIVGIPQKKKKKLLQEISNFFYYYIFTKLFILYILLIDLNNINFGV